MQGKRDAANYSVKPHDRNDVREVSQGSQGLTRQSATQQSASGHSGVGFRLQGEEYQEERKKYLTAKYGNQQMKLIRKRLSVEFWIDEQLKRLYNVQDDTETYDCDLDLDEILDLPDNEQRFQFIWNQVCSAPTSEDEILAFVHELLQKADSL